MVDIPGLVNPAAVGAQSVRAVDPAVAGRRWLGVWFTCCNVYGRIPRNAEGTMYVGFCPRCGARVQALIGEGGTSRRFFRTE